MLLTEHILRGATGGTVSASVARNDLLRRQLDHRPPIVARNVEAVLEGAFNWEEEVLRFRIIFRNFRMTLAETPLAYPTFRTPNSRRSTRGCAGCGWASSS